MAGSPSTGEDVGPAAICANSGRPAVFQRSDQDCLLCAFAMFAGALQLGGISGPAGWLALVAIALSAVALYYYLIVLKQALVAAPAPDARRIVVPPVAKLTLMIAASLIVLFGANPSLLLGLF